MRPTLITDGYWRRHYGTNQSSNSVSQKLCPLVYEIIRKVSNRLLLGHGVWGRKEGEGTFQALTISPMIPVVPAGPAGPAAP